MHELNEPLDNKDLLMLMDQGITGPSLIHSVMESDGEALVKFAMAAKGPTMKKFVKALKERCDSPEDRLIKTLRDAQEWIVVGRWLQGLRGEEHDALRWELIRNPNVDQIERSRWIERLIGRCDEPILVEEARRFIGEEHPDLLLQAAQNLSTAYDKLDL